MARSHQHRGLVRPCATHASAVLLALTLALDLTLITLFVLQGFRLITDEGLQITDDGSYGEVFQYAKLYWIGLLLAALAWRNRWRFSAGMAAVFMYFLADDYAQLHEAMGDWVARVQTRRALLGLDTEHYGELAVFFMYGVVILCLVGLFYPKPGDAERLIARDLLRLLALGAVFAVGFDLMHAMQVPEFVGDVLGTIEDGGEMIAVSLILWRTFDEFVGQLNQATTTQTLPSPPHPPNTKRRKSKADDVP
jgi:hypothetical protein